jgi:hypothetical protein
MMQRPVALKLVLENKALPLQLIVLIGYQLVDYRVQFVSMPTPLVIIPPLEQIRKKEHFVLPSLVKLELNVDM